jgi:hypothetical protein
MGPLRHFPLRSGQCLRRMWRQRVPRSASRGVAPEHTACRCLWSTPAWPFSGWLMRPSGCCPLGSLFEFDTPEHLGWTFFALWAPCWLTDANGSASAQAAGARLP